jgi:hypothetical protein
VDEGRKTVAKQLRDLRLRPILAWMDSPAAALGSPTERQRPVVQERPSCEFCGACTLIARDQEITERKRKFSLIWLCATIVTGGVALIAYAAWPRRDYVVEVDHYLLCTSCAMRQAVRTERAAPRTRPTPVKPRGQ